MRRIVYKFTVFFLLFMTLAPFSQAQKEGSLFIIGGGERPKALMQELVKTAALGSADYIVVLTMSSGVPDEAYAAVRKDFMELSSNPVTAFHFARKDADERTDWIDSVRNARLIYVTGGDQNKFMDVVRGTALYAAMHEAYNQGATVSGTSAGAAIMSRVMITGAKTPESRGDDFRYVQSGAVVTAEGMGFLTSAVIDQHFIRRSRYNRLLGVFADHPHMMMIGIDESTALVVNGRSARVVGENQVVVISQPRHMRISQTKNATFKNARLSLLGQGDTFKLKKK